MLAGCRSCRERASDGKESSSSIEVPSCCPVSKTRQAQGCDGGAAQVKWLLNFKRLPCKSFIYLVTQNRHVTDLKHFPCSTAGIRIES